MSSALVEQFKADAAARIAELEPGVAELGELRAAVTAIEMASAPASQPASPRRRGSSGGARGGRRSGHSAADEVVSVVTAMCAQPGNEGGVTVKQAADQLGKKPNYFYRLMPPLVEEGRLVKDGTRYRPAPSTASPSDEE